MNRIVIRVAWFIILIIVVSFMSFLVNVAGEEHTVALALIAIAILLLSAYATINVRKMTE